MVRRVVKRGYVYGQRIYVVGWAHGSTQDGVLGASFVADVAKARKSPGKSVDRCCLFPLPHAV